MGLKIFFVNLHIKSAILQGLNPDISLFGSSSLFVY